MKYKIAITCNLLLERFVGKLTCIIVFTIRSYARLIVRIAFNRVSEFFISIRIFLDLKSSFNSQFVYLIRSLNLENSNCKKRNASLSDNCELPNSPIPFHISVRFFSSYPTVDPIPCVSQTFVDRYFQ